MQQRDPRKGQTGQDQGRQGQNPGRKDEMEEESVTEELKCRECGETFETEEELEEHEANCSGEEKGEPG